jgi:hypothetical protein
MTVNYKFECCKKNVVSYFKVLLQHLPDGTDEKLSQYCRSSTRDSDQEFVRDEVRVMKA